MLEELKLKEKNSHFHLYIQNHLKIGQNSNHELHLKYLSKFERWKIHFNYSHGELDTQRKLNIDKINYIFNVNINAHDDIFKFIYAIDCFYLCLLTLCAAKKIDIKYTENRYKEYLSTAFFKEKNICNYYIPSNTFLGIDDLYLCDNIISLAEQIKCVNLDCNNIDLIREVFHEIYPREVRHSLGEFYTPDWMAQHITNSNSISHQSGLILDPTCGSGTFLITALRKLNCEDATKKNIRKILGFDLNPTSAFAAKTNLILNSKTVQILDEALPIFSANILDLDIENSTFLTYEDALNRITEICNNKNSAYSTEDITELEYISSIMPSLSKERAQVAIGNPPWVNWEYLPSEYKEKYKSTWQEYGLFDYKGLNSIFIKEDISSLITYATIDHYLAKGGKISFVVKESLFKSIKQAAGFRKFHIRKSNESFRIEELEDLTSFNPFNGVSNNTVIFHAIKGMKTEYPIDYKIWKLQPKSKIQDTDDLKRTLEKVKLTIKFAIPSNPEDNTSGWASVDESIYLNMDKLTGTSAYKARTGVFTGGANGIYWLNILEKPSPKSSTVENITEKARIKFKKLKSEIEDDSLYPYASGSDIKMWSHTYKKYIVCPHTVTTKMQPLPIQYLKENLPLTATYFSKFKEELKARKGFTSFDKKIHEEHYYTLQRIGDYTFSKYKVAWKYISSEFTCAVIQDAEDEFLGRKNIIPNEKIIYIGLDDKEEAFFLCGLLSSTYFRELINSFKVSTQIAPSTITNLNLPKFDSTNENHKIISSLCERGHQDLENIERYISDIDTYVIPAIHQGSLSSVK
ncbi:N-6 DNA methylase [Dongshaea marina]|uniref:N-6 DNA methylase n=1 Tax=Dongshaea marina TaxID=2047966 RepID=UPI00131ED555|nr:N-6 DNA methylase [Dongshaea marina]